jgi:hypothetical protein
MFTQQYATTETLLQIQFTENSALLDYYAVSSGNYITDVSGQPTETSRNEGKNLQLLAAS